MLDRHVLGLFARADWLRWLGECGFEPGAVPFAHSEVAPGETDLFFGLRP